MSVTAAIRLIRATTLEPLHDSSDAELLRRFCRDRDEAAFREIFRRYEVLVRGTSRRLTRDRHAVDNAVQATFLTLARKAHTIRHAEALPSWLYRVARSVMVCEAAPSSIVDEPADPTPSPLDQLSARELLSILDVEFARLPAAYRSAMLLCNIEGNTVEEAAGRLATTPGAIRGWLQRGREQLRRRLSRRGVELSVAMSFLLVDSTVRATDQLRECVVRSAMGVERPAATAARLMMGSSIIAATSISVLTVGFISSILSTTHGQVTPKAPAPMEVKEEAKSNLLLTRDNLPEGAIARIGSTRLRHAGDIVAMAISHDGRLLASASPANNDKSVRIWDLADGKEKQRIEIFANPHENSVRQRTVGVAFSHDDKRLLILDARGFQSLEVATGRREFLKVFYTEKDANQFFSAEGIVGTGFSPDRKMFAVVRRNGELLLGDTATGEVKTTIAKSMNLPANSSYSYVNVLFTPNGSEVCVPIEAESIPIFSTSTGESKRALAKELVPKYGAVNNAAFVGDGSKFVSFTNTAQDGEKPAYAVSVGDVATGKSAHKFPIARSPRVLSVSPNGKLLAVSTDSVQSSEVRILDMESGKELQSMPLSFTPALVAFSPDSKLLVGTCHFEGRVTLWDIEKNALHPQSSEEQTLMVRFDRQGNLALNRLTQQTTVDWRTGKVLANKKFERKPRFAEVLSEDGKVRAELDYPKGKADKPLAIDIKEEATNRTIARLEGVSDFPRTMAIVDQNRLLVTVTQDDVLSVWDIAAQKLLWSEKYPRQSFGYMGMGHPYFDAASRRMAICSSVQNGTVIDVWELRRQARVVKLEVPRVLLTGGIAFSRDGEFVVGGAESVTCWRVADGKVMHTLQGHPSAKSPNDRQDIRCEFSDDGRKLLTVDGTGTIRVWEFATGQSIRTFIGHNGTTVAAFAPDARHIVGASSDAPILIWDVYGLKAKPLFNAERIWNDLANESSPAAGFVAVRELCGSPQEAIALLKEKLKPEMIDTKQIDGWIKDLSAGRFTVRESATAELEKLGDTISPMLRNALDTSKEEETRQRIAAILGRMESVTPARLQIQRAMDALEHLGTPEAKEHLAALSRGSPGCLRTIQAREALSRMSGR
jgi:RNA polymerase sigma factor (sigma-70 family)